MSTGGKLRVAAVGDLHVHAAGAYRDFFVDVSRRADVLALCGDLTHLGGIAEAEGLAADLASCSVPVVGVLGNHDYQSGHAEEVRKILCAAKLVLLDKEPFIYQGVGFAGAKGFCGGFNKYMLTSFGEDAIKHFVAETVNEALQLENCLSALKTERTIVVLHYAPITATLHGEPLEIFPFLGSSRLAEAIDPFDVTAVFHGHAHRGTCEGRTNKGVPVYNCCYELMQRVHPEQPFALIEI
jgi:Icc-related predicted phosphoesterase